MKNDIERLKKLIKNNPPLNEKSKPSRWWGSDWEDHLNESLPNWQEILRDVETWKEIKGIKPRSSYDTLLIVLLEYAPAEILAEYLESNEPEEWKASIETVLKNNAEKLSTKLWRMLNKNSKYRIFSKTKTRIKINHHDVTLHHVLEILMPIGEYPLIPEKERHLFKHLSSQGKFQFSYPPLQVSFYEAFDIMHPLWIKLSAIVEEADDDEMRKIIWEYEDKVRYILERKIEKIKSLVQPLIGKRHLPKENLMFDFSLLLNLNMLEKIFQFIKENQGQFNFYVSNTFYDTLKMATSELNNLKFIRSLKEFFEVEKEISWRKVLDFLEEHKDQLILFKVEEKIYKNKYPSFYESLKGEVSEDLFKIFLEEWIFLQEFSWIVAKSKKTFEKFKDAGAVVLEVSKNALNKGIEKLARYKLNKKDDEILSTVEKLRGLGKWIAHGGITAIGASSSNPIIGALFGYSIGEGFFVLIDPEEALEETGATKNGDGL